MTFSLAGARRAVALTVSATLAAAALVATGPAGAVAAAADETPRIDRVSDVVAQTPGVYGAGPVLVIDGEGFGDTAPTLTEVPRLDDTAVGQSALGRWGNTRHLHVVDDGTFATDHAGLSPSDDDNCFVTIGKWTDTQIIVMLDDAGIDAVCSPMSEGNDISVEVWSTDGGGYGTSPGSGLRAVGEARGSGDLATVDAVFPASGPVSGGTFAPGGVADPEGTVTISGDRLREASVVWFGEARYWGAIAVDRCRDGESPAADDCFTESDGRLTVVPPASARGADRGAYLGVTTPAGTSHLGCASVFTCDRGVFYYQSPSGVLPSFDQTLQVGYPGHSVGFAGAKEVDQASCPGAAPSGPTGVSYSITAQSTSGRVRLQGQPLTSVNGTVPVISSVQVPMRLTVEEKVELEVTLSGTISGCAAFPLLGGHLEVKGGDVDGDGDEDAAKSGVGLYMMIGGKLEGSVTFTVTLNKGVIDLNAGYVPGQLGGAKITGQSCVDDEGAATECLQTGFDWNVAGSVFLSPLWVDAHFATGKRFEFGAGAGLTLAAHAEAGSKGSGYEVCYGGSYAVTATAKVNDDTGFEYQRAGPFWGPFHLLGNRPASCPLGEIELDTQATTTTVTAGDAVPGADGVAVTYTAAVEPSAATGTVSFTRDGDALGECTDVEIADGAATCTLTYAGAGTPRIVATYGGDSGHQSSTSEELEHEVQLGAQTVDFTLPESGVFGGSLPLSATCGASGASVTFAVAAASAGVCRITAAPAGPVVELTGLGDCVVTASQAAAGGYAAAADVVRTVTVRPASQEVQFALPSTGTFGERVPLAATGGASGAPVTFAVAAASDAVCRIATSSGSTVLELIGVGGCEVTASRPRPAGTPRRPRWCAP